MNSPQSEVVRNDNIPLVMILQDLILTSPLYVGRYRLVRNIGVASIFWGMSNRRLQRILLSAPVRSLAKTSSLRSLVQLMSHFI